MEPVSTTTAALTVAALLLTAWLERQKTKPARDARAARQEATDDLDALNHGLRDNDPEAVAAFFERERLEAWGRLNPPAAARPAARVQPGGDDSGEPDARSAAGRTVGRD